MRPGTRRKSWRTLRNSATRHTTGSSLHGRNKTKPSSPRSRSLRYQHWSWRRTSLIVNCCTLPRSLSPSPRSRLSLNQPRQRPLQHLTLRAPSTTNQRWVAVRNASLRLCILLVINSVSALKRWLLYLDEYFFRLLHHVTLSIGWRASCWTATGRLGQWWGQARRTKHTAGDSRHARDPDSWLAHWRGVYGWFKLLRDDVIYTNI